MILGRSHDTEDGCLIIKTRTNETNELDHVMKEKGT